MLKAFLRNEEGQDLIEYALLAALIAVGSIVVLGQISGGINNIFTRVLTAVNGAS